MQELTYQEKMFKMRKEAIGKIIGRAISNLVAKDEEQGTKRFIGYLGGTGFKLFYDKYGPQIEQEVTRITHKIIDSAKAQFYSDHEDHIDDSAESLTDKIWRDNAPKK